MKPAPPSASQPDPRDSRRPVFSPQFGNAYADIRQRPGNGEDDDANTEQTVSYMSELAHADATAPIVTAATREAIHGARDRREQIRSIYAWIQRHVIFQDDALTAALAMLPEPASAEILIRPADILEMQQPAGDCDDFTMLSVSMLTAAGIPARIVAIEQDAARPGYFSHVYAETHDGMQWQPFDTSHGDRVGWYAPPTGKRREWQKGNAPMKLSRMNGSRLNGWEEWIDKGIDITGKILVPRLGVPQAPGGVIRLPDGTYAANQPSGASIQFPGVNANTIGESPKGGGALLGIAAVVVAVIVFAKIAKS